MSFPVACVTFASDAAKDTGASDATNGMMALVLANLAAGVEVDGSDHIVHYDSRTGLADPAGGIHNWSFPDTTDHRLPLPHPALVSDLVAIVQGLENLATPPSGCLQTQPLRATPADPCMQGGPTNPGARSWTRVFIDISRNADDPHTNGNIYPLTLQAGGYMDADGNMVSWPADQYLLEEILLNVGIGYSAAARDAELQEYGLFWDNTGNIDFRYDSWVSRSGTGSGKVATWDADGFFVADIQTTSVPVENRSVIRTDWKDIHDAGAEIGLNFEKIFANFRIIRFMDLNNVNSSVMTSYSQIPPRSYRYWAHNQGAGHLGTKYNYAGPPLSVLVDMCNKARTHMHYCIPANMDDAGVAAIATYVKANLAPDLAFLPEYSNESWNSIFTVFHDNHAKGLDFFNTVAVNAGTGYDVDDQVYVLDRSWTVTAATNANPCQLTINGTGTLGYEDIIYISGVGGMTELNGAYYRAYNWDNANRTFTIGNLDGSAIDATAFGAFTSGGTVQSAGWTFRVDAIDGSGTPTAMPVIRRQQRAGTSSLTVVGGSGTGLNVTITEHLNTDFPSWSYSMFRAAEVMNIIKGVYGGDFLTKCRPVFGVQSRNPGLWSSNWLPGFNLLRNGMAGHPTHAAGLGLDVDELFHALVGTNYVGPSMTGNPSLVSQALTWLATSQDEFEIQLELLRQAELTDNLSALGSWKTVCDGLGILLGTYEGMDHNDAVNVDAAVLAAQRTYNNGARGLAFQRYALEQYRAVFGNWLTDFNLIGSDTSGNPWYATDAAGLSNPRLNVVKAFNAEFPGSRYDTISAAVDFSVGPSYGCQDVEGVFPGPCTDPVMFGGRCSSFNGDGTNLAIMYREGISVNCAETWVPGVAADYTPSWPDVNGCVNLKRSGTDFFGHRFHPSKGGDIRFMGDFSRVAVSSYVS